jgi:hypothetical protein
MDVDTRLATEDPGGVLSVRRGVRGSASTADAFVYVDAVEVLREMQVKQPEARFRGQEDADNNAPMFSNPQFVQPIHPSNGSGGEKSSASEVCNSNRRESQSSDVFLSGISEI